MQYTQLINPELRKASLAILATILAATLVFAALPGALGAIDPIVDADECAQAPLPLPNGAVNVAHPPGQDPAAPDQGNDQSELRALKAVGFFADPTVKATSGEGKEHCTGNNP